MSKFRQVFTLGNEVKGFFNFFPGHMSKGIWEMQKRLGEVDCIVEVHDARIPLTGRNPVFTEKLSGRPRILILNKKDLAENSQVNSIAKVLGVDYVMRANSKRSADHTVKELIPKIIDIVDQSSCLNRSEREEYNVLIVGVPNAGKSSLLNALRRQQHFKKVAATGAIAGVTRRVMEKVKVNADPRVYVYDTPGILQPNIRDVESGMKLALCGNMYDHLIGEEKIADYMLYWLNKNHRYEYIDFFKFKQPTDEIVPFLLHVSKEYKLKCIKNLSLSGGYVYHPNLLQAAQMSVKAFRDGRLGRVNLDTDILERHKVNQNLETFSNNPALHQLHQTIDLNPS